MRNDLLDVKHADLHDAQAAAQQYPNEEHTVANDKAIATTDKALKLKKPEPDDKSEMVGRMYEAWDLQMAIEGGHLQIIDDVLAWAKEESSGLQKLIELPVWLINENACVDVKASIEHNENAPFILG